MDLHPALAPMAFLAGKWEGAGHGQYPTIESFSYREKIAYRAPPGKPFFTYRQHTETMDGSPLHAEVGYLRMSPSGPELVIAQPTGLAEIHTGTLDGSTIEFRSAQVAATPTAKQVSEVARTITVEGDTLTYTLDMAYRDVPLSLHLEATLDRMPSGR